MYKNYKKLLTSPTLQVNPLVMVEDLALSGGHWLPTELILSSGSTAALA